MQSSAPTREALQEALQEARSRVDTLTHIVDQVRAHVLNERHQGMPNDGVIEQQLNNARVQLDSVTSETRTHKEIIKRYRADIEQWDRWYHSLADIDRDVQRSHLENEFMWRMNAISGHEAQIAACIQLEYVLIATIETLQAQLTAFREGVFDLPVDSDPRLLSAIESLTDARDTLAALEGLG